MSDYEFGKDEYGFYLECECGGKTTYDTSAVAFALEEKDVVYFDCWRPNCEKSLEIESEPFLEKVIGDNDG